MPVLLDVPRILVLADLAIEFLEIVLDGAADHLLLHLRLVPLLQTSEMHQPARTAAFTRAAQESVGLFGLTHVAIFALLLGEVQLGVLCYHYFLCDRPKLALIL